MSEHIDRVQLAPSTETPVFLESVEDALPSGKPVRYITLRYERATESAQQVTLNPRELQDLFFLTEDWLATALEEHRHGSE